MLAAIGAACREAPPAPPAVRLTLAAPPEAELGFGDEPLDAAISPDETQIVFVATVMGTPRLWRRALAGERADMVPGTDGAQQPAWKHTGRVVSFFAGGALHQVALDTEDAPATDSGGPRDVRRLADAPMPAGAAWLPDGSVLFAGDSRGPIRRLRNNVLTDATRLHEGDRAHAFPSWTGRAESFVYIALRDNGRRIVRLVDEQGERDLTATSAHAQVAGGTLVHVQDGVLRAQRIDAGTGELTGNAATLATAVGVTSAGRGLFAASQRLVITARPAPRPRQLLWLDTAGAAAGVAGEPGEHWQVRLSPDDRYAAVTSTDPLLRTLDIFVMATAGASDTRKLTLALDADSDPVWSPDGTRIAFRSMQDGQPNLFARRAHTMGASIDPLLRSELDETPTDWRGVDVFFHSGARTVSGSPSAADLWRLDTATGERTPLARGGFSESDARLSPSRNESAYVADDSGRPEVYVGFGDARVRVSSGGGTRPRWRRDGAAIFFVQGTRIMRADRAGPGFAPAQPVADVPGIRDFDAAHRRDRLLVLAAMPGTTTPNVDVIVDWQSIGR